MGLFAAAAAVAALSFGSRGLRGFFGFSSTSGLPSGPRGTSFFFRGAFGFFGAVALAVAFADVAVALVLAALFARAGVPEAG